MSVNEPRHKTGRRHIIHRSLPGPLDHIFHSVTKLFALLLQNSWAIQNVKQEYRMNVRQIATWLRLDHATVKLSLQSSEWERENFWVTGHDPSWYWVIPLFSLREQNAHANRPLLRSFNISICYRFSYFLFNSNEKRKRHLEIGSGPLFCTGCYCASVWTDQRTFRQLLSKDERT